jgi:outer membrane usher protein
MSQFQKHARRLIGSFLASSAILTICSRPAWAQDAVQPAAAQPPVAAGREQAEPPVARPTAPTVPSLAVPLKFNGVLVGEIEAAIEPSGDVLINVEQLIQVAAGTFSEEIRTDLRRRAGPDALATLRELSQDGLTLSYDPALSEINATIAADRRSQSALQLRPEESFDYALFRQSADTTAFLNIFSAITHSESDLESETGFSAILDGGFRLFGAEGVALRGTVFVDTTALQEFRRGEFFLFHDDVETLRRYSAGDLFIDSTDLQGALPFAGVSVQKLFRLQPRLFTRPIGRTSFLLERPSTVQVLINGQPVRTLRLNPGPYDLSNFPFVEGANDVQVQVVDDTGAREVFNFTQFFSGELLRQGLNEYAYHAGIIRESRFGAIDYLEDEWVVSGFHRYGLTDNLTIGGNAQATKDVIQIGGQVLFSSNLGTFDISASGSKSEGSEVSFAASVDYLLFLRGLGERFANASLQVSVDYVGRNFASIAAPFVENDIRWRFASSLSMPIIGSINANLSGSYIDNRFTEDRFSADLGLSARIANRFNAFVSVGYDDGGPSGRGLSFLVNLTALLGPRQTASVRYSSDSDLFTAQYVHANAGKVGSIGFSGLAQVDTRDGNISGDATIDYFGNRFLASASQSASFVDGTSNIQSLTRLSASTAIVMSDGQFGLSRPVNDGFVIIGRHPTLAGAEIRIEDGPEGALAYTDWLGPAVIPEVGAYQPRTIDFEVIGAPLGYDIGDSNRIVLLPEVGSRYFEIGSEDTITVIGNLTTADGQPLSYAVGQVTAPGRSDFVGRVFFTNSAGRFSIPQLRAGQYVITLNDGRTATLIVPEDSSNLLTLQGNLIVGGEQ